MFYHQFKYVITHQKVTCFIECHPQIINEIVEREKTSLCISNLKLILIKKIKSIKFAVILTMVVLSLNARLNLYFPSQGFTLMVKITVIFHHQIIYYLFNT